MDISPTPIEVLLEAKAMLAHAEAVYDAIKDLSSRHLQMVLGTAIDAWAANNNKSMEETFEILKTLSCVQEWVYETAGPHPKERAPEDKEPSVERRNNNTI